MGSVSSILVLILIEVFVSPLPATAIANPHKHACCERT